MKAAVVALGLLFLSGCVSSNYVYVPNTIPYGVQQNLRTVGSGEVAFEFQGHQNAETVVATLEKVKSVQYQMNTPMRSMFRELIESKFPSLNPEAEDKIYIEVKEFVTYDGGDQHQISMTLRVVAEVDQKMHDREFSYRLRVPMQRVPVGMAPGVTLPPDAIHDYLLKYVVATDRFIDGIFGVDQTGGR